MANSNTDTTPLHIIYDLISKGDVKSLTDYLESEENVEMVQIHSSSKSLTNPSSEKSISNNDSKTAKSLIETPPIHLAIKKRNYEILYLLYEYDETFLYDESNESCVDVSRDGFSLPALHLASLLNLPSVLISLISLGASLFSTTSSNIDSCIYKSYTIAHIAAFQGNLRILQALLFLTSNMKNTKRYYSLELKNNCSKFHIHEASSNLFEHLKSIFYLRDAKQKTATLYYDEEGNLMEHDQTNDVNDDGNQQYDEDQIRFLKSTLDFDYVDSSTGNTIQFSFNNVNLSKTNDIFNDLLNQKNQNRETVLHLSTYQAHFQIVKFVLQLAEIQNNNQKEQVKDDDSDLDDSMSSTTDEDLYLIDVDSIDHRGLSPLMIACSRGFYTILELFINYHRAMKGTHGLRFDRTDERNGDGILHLACQSQLQRVFYYNYELSRDHYQTIYTLILNGIDIHQKNKDGDEPLDLIFDPAADMFEALHIIADLDQSSKNNEDPANVSSHQDQLKSGLKSRSFILSLFPSFDSLLQSAYSYRNTNTPSDSQNNRQSSYQIGVLNAQSFLIFKTRYLALNQHGSTIPFEQFVDSCIEFYKLIESQENADDERLHSCKLLDTTSIPRTRKFKHISNDERLAASKSQQSQNNSNSSGKCPMGFSNQSDDSPAPKVSKCPMGFTGPNPHNKSQNGHKSDQDQSNNRGTSNKEPNQLQSEPSKGILSKMSFDVMIMAGAAVSLVALGIFRMYMKQQ